MKNPNAQPYLSLAIGALASAALGTTAHAQSQDALLQKLVQKGILTQQEAENLRAEPTNAAPKSFLAKMAPLPDWITSFGIYGDMRGRFEQHGSADPQSWERDRFRYRLRIGTTLSFLDNFDVGVRLASGDPQFTASGKLVGGQSITANQTLGSLMTRKFIWLDAAYARWTPIRNETFTLDGVIGKMDQPFQLDNMVWDYDINPEGGALQAKYNLSDKHTLKANTAFFVLDEIANPIPGPPAVPTTQASHDPYVYGEQLLLESKWTPKLESAIGVAVFDIVNRDGLNSKVQPFYNAGNTYDPVTGTLKYNINPIVTEGSLTYKLDSFPLYPGKFPIKLMGDYMENPAAPSNNRAFRAGVMFGKAAGKHTWEIGYRYQRLEADSWLAGLVDDDNAAFYALGNPQLAGTGVATGYFGGTNVKGHLIQLTYRFTDFLDFTFYGYFNDLVVNAPGLTSSSRHFYCDLNWRF
ncbi:MAG: putative porin [Verrucomicrobia bacterium]|nr:putative porin [Verrucomicrobiota bacterium]